MEAEARFGAMGTRAHVIVVGGRPGLVREAALFLDDLERRWSRFLPDSEVSALTRSAGVPVGVSRPTLGLVERAVEGARVTGGRFDPTVLGAVIRAGYDRTFDLLSDSTRWGESTLGLGVSAIEVDPIRSTVTLPPGVGFDPGGIGKGFAADLLVADLVTEGAAGACVSIGGDLRAEGEGIGGNAWTIAIEHPLAPDPAALIGITRGAVATSTRARRAWGPPNDRRHHLIDPSTGRSAASGLLSATAIAAEAWQAEVLAKAAFIAGLDEGLEVLRERGTDGLLVDDAGRVHTTEGFAAFAGTRSDRGAAAGARAR